MSDYYRSEISAMNQWNKDMISYYIDSLTSGYIPEAIECLCGVRDTITYLYDLTIEEFLGRRSA